MAEQSWNENFRQWIENNPRANELNNYLSKKVIYEWATGRVRDLESINLGTRSRVYKITGLQDFYFNGYVDPDSIDIKKVISREHPLKYAQIFLDLNGVSVSQFAREAKVDRKTALKFFDGGTIKGDKIKNRLTNCLRNYAKRFSGDTADEDKFQKTEHSDRIADNKTGENKSTHVSDIGKLVAGVEALRREVGVFGRDYNPTYEERMKIIESNIDSIIEQLKYYVSASQQERDELAAFLDIERWGFVVNVLGGIARKEGSPENFARRVSPPEKRRNRK